MIDKILHLKLQIVKDFCPLQTSRRIRVLSSSTNSDNVIMAANDVQAANAVWLKKWRGMLKRAQQTHGVCVQIVSTDEGLSPMQEAEADMAGDKNVRVVQLEFSGSMSDDEVNRVLSVNIAQ